MVVKARNLVNPGAPSDSQPRCIYGVHAVAEWVRNRPGELRAVHYEARAAARLTGLLRAATTAGVRVEPCSAGRLAGLVGPARHQGVVATAAPFPYAALEEVVAARPSLLILADQMQDPQNLGALLRTAAAVGSGAVILPKDGSVPVTAVVEAAAAGAAALLPVCRVTNAERTLRILKDRGYWAWGLVPKHGVDLFRADPPQPLVVVVGGESGIRNLVAKRCDTLVSIPMAGRVESLNAAVAAAIAMYHVRCQWGGLTETRP